MSPEPAQVGAPLRPASTPTEQRTARRRFARVTANMTIANGVILMAALATGPLQARALGPTGRGDLAAVLVVFSLGPLMLHFGLGVYGAREAARGRPVGPLLGSLGCAALAVGVIGAVAGIPLVNLLAGDRPEVRDLMLVALALLPLGLAGTVVVSIVSGLEGWATVILSRLIPPVTGLVGIVVLYITGELTVFTAALLSFGGAVASMLPLLRAIKWRRLKFDAGVIRDGLPYGLKAWLGGLANLSNARLDQFLMIPLVSSKQLGFYAVAVSIAGFSGALTAGLGPPLFTRVAAGETALVARALRVTLALVGAVSVFIAAAAPLVIPILFGSSFGGAISMTWILLAAGIPLAGGAVLAPALAAAGKPGASALAEGLALVLTVLGLVLLLPSLGGVGAAIASLAAYGASFAVLLMAARREFGVNLRELLAAKRSDVRWGSGLVRAAFRTRWTGFADSRGSSH